MDLNIENGRRDFIQKMAILSGATALRIPKIMHAEDKPRLKNPLCIDRAIVEFEREPLIDSYGFKGGHITRLWQIATQMKDVMGNEVVGLGVQSPLWSDSRVTSRWSESGSNSLMYNLTARALQLIEGRSFSSPIHMLDDIFDEVNAYGRTITNNENLRRTFTLNSLVSLDNAAWLLFAKQNGIASFDDLIPSPYRAGLSYRHDKIACVPSISYSTTESDIEALMGRGYRVLKIKIGSPGSQEEMLEKDVRRMAAIHKKVDNLKVNPLKGKILYYLDANGRYETKERFEMFLDKCSEMGAFGQILVVEEPFPESFEGDVSDLGVDVAADESAHTDKDALLRMEMGYSVMALKPVAKTLSMTMKIAQLAHERKIPCFCADLTVNPVMVDWNKSIAARLAPLPKLKVGLLETNGHQNYRNWDEMVGYHPKGGASWNKLEDGMFNLYEEFYDQSAGMFLPLEHYSGLFDK